MYVCVNEVGGEGRREQQRVKQLVPFSATMVCTA